LAARASMRKQATKEALSDWSTAKRQEIAAFLEEFRKDENVPKNKFESGNPTYGPLITTKLNINETSQVASKSPTTYPPPSGYNKPAVANKQNTSERRIDRFVRSIRLNKPVNAAAAAPSSKPIPVKNNNPFINNQNATRGGMKSRMVSVSLKNFNIRERMNNFQKA
jgi:hypothetical protein